MTNNNCTTTSDVTHSAPRSRQNNQRYVYIIHITLITLNSYKKVLAHLQTTAI